MSSTSNSFYDPGLAREINALYKEQYADITSFLCALIKHPSLLGGEDSAQNFIEETFTSMDLVVDSRAKKHQAQKKS